MIVLGEYRYGISQSRYRRDYERWLGEYLSHFRILEVDERTTLSYSAVRTELKKAGTPIPSNDVPIAALCRQHSLPLLSRDRHFDAVAGITRVESESAAWVSDNHGRETESPHRANGRPDVAIRASDCAADSERLAWVQRQPPGANELR